MLVCIVGMCTIGIRFLVKPTTEREDSAAKGEKLDWKGIYSSA